MHFVTTSSPNFLNDLNDKTQSTHLSVLPLSHPLLLLLLLVLQRVGRLGSGLHCQCAALDAAVAAPEHQLRRWLEVKTGATCGGIVEMKRWENLKVKSPEVCVFYNYSAVEPV